MERLIIDIHARGKRWLLIPFVIPKIPDHLRFEDLFSPLRRSHKTRSKMATAIAFSRQNDPGSSARTLSVLGKLVPVQESKGL